jgi:phosphatidylglycerol:prolipoprotein diacylglycerol transferase
VIPYVEFHQVDFLGLHLPVFGSLVVVAVLLARWRLGRIGNGLDVGGPRDVELLSLVMLASGFLCSHIVKLAVASLSGLLASPYENFIHRAGMMSIGGFYGGLAAGVIFCLVRGRSPRQILFLLDRIAFVLPASWLVGRLGCALIHDHIGHTSTSILAVRFPTGPAYDLGVLEFLFLIPLTILFEVLGHFEWYPGFFFGLFGVLYGALRTWLEMHQRHVNWGVKAGISGALVGVLGWLSMWWFARSCPEQGPIAMIEVSPEIAKGWSPVDG